MKPNDKVPQAEINQRIERFRSILGKDFNSIEGCFIFSGINTYYFTGHFGNGVLWLPLDGEPVLFCRKGWQRAQMESPLKHIVAFKSYREIPGILADFNQKLTGLIGVEKGILPWQLAERFTKYITDKLIGIDYQIFKTRAVKSDWELRRLKIAGSKHNKCLTEDLVELIKPGMTEWEIAVKLCETFFENGHQGPIRTQNFGMHVFIGHVSAGDSGNYPSVFNGPVGLRGAHPAMPFLGNPEKIWANNEPLNIDCAFVFEGYHTDKTQVYFPKGWQMPKIVKQAQDFCLDLQFKIAEKLVPGAIPSELYRYSLELAERQGFAEGFMGIGDNKVNFIGHGIGLALDEYPAIAQGFDEPLEENMVIAIEPKIGISGIGMVGVENTFVVTPKGGQSLTGNSKAVFI